MENKSDKLTVNQRINLLLDPDSFVEFGSSTGKDNGPNKDGVITGYGKINERPVYIYAQDFSYMGGSMGKIHCKKILGVVDLAIKNGAPLIGLLESGGARIQDSIDSLDGGGLIFLKNTQASGVIPQISIIFGPCAGIAVYSPALTDFIFLIKGKSNMFVTGPDVVKSVTGEVINLENLGGTTVHSEESGIAHVVSEDERVSIKKVRELLSYLPENNLEDPPLLEENVELKSDIMKLSEIVPQDTKKPYDIKEVIKAIVDHNSFFELQEAFAKNVVIGFGRLKGRVIGIVANQPKVLAGCIDINASNKIARFVRFLDCFNIPIINLVDVPGYLPGLDQERGGIIKCGAKVLYAYCEATVPKVVVILRKAYGGAYIALASKEMGFDKVIAWPKAEIGVMGAEQGIKIIHKKEIEKSSNKEDITKEKLREYNLNLLNLKNHIDNYKIDAIIQPDETRGTLIRFLEILSNKRVIKIPKKHGNIPL